MANENDMKTSNAAGPSGTESPVKSPAGVPVLSFDVEAFLRRPLLAYRPERPERSWVYLMRCDRFVKVGISNDVPKRLRGLQGAVPFEVTLAKKYVFDDRQYAWLAEQTCHAVMRDFRTYGEWFDINFPTALSVVKEVVPATRQLMTIHNRLQRQAQEAASERYASDPGYRARLDAQRASNAAWLAKDEARRKALREADAAFERCYPSLQDSEV